MGAVPRHLQLILRFLAAATIAALAGCQIQTVSAVRLEIHQSLINRSGLAPLHLMSKLHISCAPPEQWDQLPLSSNLLYSHQQWRSPDRHVGIGVAYMHTPIMFSPQTLIWFAKAHYASSDNGSGKLLAAWTDALGRCWFEAENDTFHVRGYAMTRGYDAWIVYSGYRVKAHPPQSEVQLAARGAETVAPLVASE